MYAVPITPARMGTESLAGVSCSGETTPGGLIGGCTSLLPRRFRPVTGKPAGAFPGGCAGLAREDARG